MSVAFQSFQSKDLAKGVCQGQLQLWALLPLLRSWEAAADVPIRYQVVSFLRPREIKDDLGLRC